MRNTIQGSTRPYQHKCVVADEQSCDARASLPACRTYVVQYTSTVSDLMIMFTNQHTCILVCTVKFEASCSCQRQHEDGMHSK